MQNRSPHRSHALPMLAAMSIAVGILAGCGSSDNGVTVLTPGTAKIQGVMRNFESLPGLGALTGASVSGLGAGLSVTLQNNAGDDVTLSSNSAFSFPTEIKAGGAYAVTVKAQPLGQSCIVDNGSGTVDAQGTSVANVAVNCKATSSIGGGLRGLNTGESVSILNNGIVTQLGANGAFALPGTSIPGSQYAVTVFAQPATGICTVSNGTGVVVDNVMGLVGINCASTAPDVKGALTGLALGETVELQNNAGGTIALSSNQSFAFAANVAPGATYAVAVSRQPVTQACTVQNGSGTINVNGDVVSDVAVHCSTSSSVGASVSGLVPGATLVLSNGGASVTVSGNGLFAFPGVQTPGTGYSVTVASQPAGQVCQLTNATGVAVDGETQKVGVKCLGLPLVSLSMPAPVALGGSATGLVPVTNTLSMPIAVATSTTGDGWSTTQACATIAVGATCAVPVSLSPNQSGPLIGSLSLVVDGGTPILVPLAGVGDVAPVLPGALWANPSALMFGFSFGDIAAGQVTAEQQLVLENTGGSSINIDTPTTSPDFTVVSNSCPQALEPQDTCTVGVRFTPSSASGSSMYQYRTGTLTVTSNGGNLVLPLDGGITAEAASLPVAVVGLQTTFGGFPTFSSFSLNINGTMFLMNANGTVNLQNGFLDPNGSYVVTIGSQPTGMAGQSCAVTDGVGSFSHGVASTSPVITCTTPPPQSIVGNVSGLPGGATIQLTSNFTPLTVTADGGFVLTVTPGSTMYSLQVTQQPGNGAYCTVTNGSGSFDPLTGASSTTPSVTCAMPVVNTVTIALSGSGGATVFVLNHGSPVLLQTGDGLYPVTGDTSFSYALQVMGASNPLLSCSIADGNGTYDAVTGLGSTTPSIACH